MSNLEAAAEAFAQQKQAAYVAKRGGSVPAKVAFDVYLWAFNSFLKNPDQSAA